MTDCYFASIVVRGQIISFHQRSLSGDRSCRLIDVLLDGVQLGEIEINSSYYPSISLCQDGPEVVVYASSDLYLILLDERSIVPCHDEDSVHTVYSYGAEWCLVGDISVALVNLKAGVQAWRCWHDEIFLESKKEDDKLLLEDLQRRKFTLDISSDSPQLQAVDSRSDVH